MLVEENMTRQGTRSQSHRTRHAVRILLQENAETGLSGKMMNAGEIQRQEAQVE